MKYPLIIVIFLLLNACSSFKEVVMSLKSNQSEKAVMAIENSIAGAILPNYALIDKNELEFLKVHGLNNIKIIKIR